MASIPVIIGVADVKNKTGQHKEPANLMLEAILSAIEDTCSPKDQLRSQIDAIDVVRTWTWAYADLPGLLSEKLGLRQRPKWTRYTATHGGNQPAKLVDEAAVRIARGETTVAVVTGGEALASLTASARAGIAEPPGWTKPDTPVQDVAFRLLTQLQLENIGGIHSIGAPIHIYPLYENAFRAHRGQTPRENNDESASLYADFAKVAAENQYSWNYGKQPTSKEEIGTVSRRNRMICSPYPLLMNAFNTVNLAAACILTSVEKAKELGVPEEKWIYPLGGAGRKEREHFWERPNFFHSEAISLALDDCMASSGVKIDDIDALDLYSCFPIVPKLACHHLGLPVLNPIKPLTLLGGLTSFGGAGNNYSMHAITEMCRQIRHGKFRKGLVLANGGVLSYQHAICLSSVSRGHGSFYPDSRVSSDAVVDEPAPTVETFAEGEALIETYTVEFGRDGKPETAFIIGRLEANGRRFVANHGDQRTLQRVSSALEEQVGKKGYVSIMRTSKGEPERNLFFLGPKPGL
ncbi:acetyl-CoA acetyltransferase [Cryphonectria parasitica EP155]|uniref:Acetyl-CoA acetyltransferase n=1 Tax=Cryphonectria parasitica (strain ATCC 38755 / EP155) TaxID=660469 RepID=A0A9P5CPT5_CRYP1|nr:acetyl-CoA acetyltransferase [Cryphonectria parasitica EP155]KAF3766819.1 acetyl-CoA acetyltransferase [Cryphonectria parasitica EP155]